MLTWEIARENISPAKISMKCIIAVTILYQSNRFDVALRQQYLNDYKKCFNNKTYIWMVKFIKGEINIYSFSENVHCLQYMNVNLRTLLRTNWNETFFTSHQRICFVLQCIVVCYRCFTDTLQRNKEEMFMHKMCLMTQEQIWKGKTDTEVIFLCYLKCICSFINILKQHDLCHPNMFPQKISDCWKLKTRVTVK